VDVDQVRRAVEATRWRVRWVAETDSTNRVLVEEARVGEAGDDVLIADFQTAGRGRLGRAWTARPGSGLLMSVSLAPTSFEAWRPLGPVTAVSLAAADACAAVAGVSVGLKWPNDLVVGNGVDLERKLAGVLAEAVAAGGSVTRVVVGIGLNVGWPDPPDDVRSTVAALDIEAGRPVLREEVAASLLCFLEEWLTKLTAEPASVLGAYRDRCCTLGRSVRVELADRVVTGTAVDIDPSGRIVIEGTDGRQSLSVGDVVHLRPG